MKLLRTITIAAATLVIAAVPPGSKAASPAAQRVPAPTTFNCLIASNLFAQKAADEKQRAVAFQTLYFYLGRLNPATTATQLKTGLKLSEEGLNGASAAALMNACFGELQGKARLLQSVGQQLQRSK